MIVCLCASVSDRKIRQAILLGAQTREEIEDFCGAGSQCGSCHDQIEDLLHEAKELESKKTCDIASAVFKPYVVAHE